MSAKVTISIRDEGGTTVRISGTVFSADAFALGEALTKHHRRYLAKWPRLDAEEAAK